MIEETLPAFGLEHPKGPGPVGAGCQVVFAEIAEQDGKALPLQFGRLAVIDFSRRAAGGNERGKLRVPKMLRAAVGDPGEIEIEGIDKKSGRRIAYTDVRPHNMQGGKPHGIASHSGRKIDAAFEIAEVADAPVGC